MAGNTLGMARQSTAESLPVLLTRPLPQSRAFAALLHKRFGNRLRPVIAPLQTVESLTPPRPEGAFDAVIFTSSNAVPAAQTLGWALPTLAWCVGAKTAEIARKAGYRTRSADGDADALVAAIVADPPGRLLHLHGTETRGAVVERLRAAGLKAVAVEVYQQTPQPLTAEALELLHGGGVVIVPLFSPRSAALFAAAVAGLDLSGLRLAVMSGAVAKAAPRGVAALVMATQPQAGAMLDAVGALIEGRLP